MSAFSPPTPKPGRVMVMFKYPTKKNWSANIVLPNGHTEIMKGDLLGTQLNSARALAMHRVHALYRQFGIAGKAKRARDAAKAAGEPLPEKRRPGRPPGPGSSNGDHLNGAPSGALSPILRRYVRGFRDIEELVILGTDDPVRFSTEVRAIVLQSLRGRGKTLGEPE